EKGVEGRQGNQQGHHRQGEGKGFQGAQGQARDQGAQGREDRERRSVRPVHAAGPAHRSGDSRADRDVDADRSARRSDRGAQEEGVKSSSELRSAFLAAATTAGGSAALSRPVCWPIRPTKGVSALTAAMRTARFRQASVNERAPPELTWKGATTSKGPPPPGLALADGVIDPLARLAGAAEARVTVPV